MLIRMNMNGFEKFFEKGLPDKNLFYRSLKDGITNNKSETLGRHISDEA